jgi:3-hydroxybutyrate dehydrogenase
MTMAPAVRLDLASRTAVVTGAGAPIGRACALRLADAAAGLLLVDRDRAAAAEVAAATGGRAVIADLTDPSTLDRLDPALDVVVNNADFQHGAALEEFPADRFARLLTVQVEAAFRLVRCALPHMYANGWGRM